ncbi:MAG: Mut7-C RNAse domain-containing protein [Candidatus Thorarchaeota archaeon]
MGGITTTGRFIVDAMLGRLTPWLRLTGNDTLYSVDYDDDTLLELAEKEDRVLLTSDAELYQRAQERGIRSMLVRGDVDTEVADVFRTFKIPPLIDPNRSRCSKCNGELQHIIGPQKTQIKGLVHDQTYEYYNEFWLCTSCHSVFFQGGHWQNMLDYMKRIADMIGSVEPNGE